MKYIMVTNWHGHWDNLRNSRTLFTESMFRNGINKDLLKNGTCTMFIKKNRDTRQVEKAWKGKVYNFEDTIYKNLPAVAFTVTIEEEVSCPEEYLNYSEGWYVESVSRESISPTNIDKWHKIEREYEVSKCSFGRKIGFVKSDFKRKIIFRDVEQAYSLLKSGFYKPSLILAGGVIEELLRLYLIHKKIRVSKNTFDEYIGVCKKKGLSKAAISSLTTSARHFRNLVHLEREKTSRYTISKSTATMAVASIFTIINDF